jgi:hypothetical protein
MRECKLYTLLDALNTFILQFSTVVSCACNLYVAYLNRFVLAVTVAYSTLTRMLYYLICCNMYYTVGATGI